MHKKHLLFMLACCLIPIAGFALVTGFNLPLKSVFYFGIIILCPLSHLLMMKFMMRGEEHHPAATAAQPMNPPGEGARAES